MAKPVIQPLWVFPASLIAFAPFRYVWNNLPRSAGEHVTLILIAMVAGYFIIAMTLSWILTACWRLWKPD